jgi:hypothetical protein
MKTKLITALLAMLMGTSAIYAGGPQRTGLVSEDRFEEQNKAIQQDLLHISAYRQNIRFMKERVRHDRKAGNKLLVALDKKELSKTRADLRKEKHYLRTDSRDLRNDYRVAIRERKRILRVDQKRLAESKRVQRKYDHTPNYTSLNDETVAVNERDVAADKEALKELRSAMSTNLLAVNKDIRRSKAEFFVVNYAETGMAGISSWMRK